MAGFEKMKGIWLPGNQEAGYQSIRISGRQKAEHFTPDVLIT